MRKRSDSNAGQPQLPRLRKGIDLTKLGLSFDEGNIASRLDGKTSIHDVAGIIGKSKEDAEKILDRLVRAGVVQIGEVTEDLNQAPKPDALTNEQGEIDYGNYIFSAHLMHEECGLTEDERKRIIWFFEHLQQWTNYELLQVRRRDESKAIKDAYYLRSKDWHPDRFHHRSNLGSFRPMIDQIYRRIKEAYEVLSDPAARKRYDTTVVFAPDEDEMAEMLEKDRKIEREKRREIEMIERRRKRNPVRKQKDNARQYYQMALDKEEAKDVVGALRFAQTAQAFDPTPEYAEMVERLKAAAGEHRIGPYLRRGLHQESLTQWDDAVRTFEEAVRLAPEHGPLRLRLAYNMLMAGRDAQDARTHAAKAAQLLPDEPEAHFVLGMCYEKSDMEKAAKSAYAKALELKPNYADVKKRLKKLKWGFLRG